MSLMLNFDDVKNLLREGLREETGQVAELQADLDQFREQRGSIGVVNPNANSSRNPARQTMITLSGDDKAVTVIELGISDTENEDKKRQIACSQDNKEQKQQQDSTNTNSKNDPTENSLKIKDNVMPDDMEQQKNTQLLNYHETAESSGIVSPNNPSIINRSSMKELISMVQYLNVKLQGDVGERLTELDDASWTSLLIKLQTAKKALLAALICRGIFLIFTAYFSCMSLWSLSKPISRLVVIYFLKNLIVVFFHDSLNKLLVARINLYYKLQDQLLKLKAKMEKLLGKALLEIGEIAKTQSQQSESELKSNGEDEGTQNKEEHLQGNNILDKDLEGNEGSQDKNSQIQPLEENSNNTSNNNGSTVQSSGSSPEQEQESKRLITQEFLQVQHNTQENACSDLSPPPYQPFQNDNEQNPEQLIPQQPSISSQIWPLKIKLSKIKFRISQLCEGEMNQSLNDFKRKFDSDNSTHIDLLTKIKNALLVSQPQLQLLSHLLQFLSLILTVSACTLIFKDIPEDTPYYFVLIIWLNIAQDNLQLLAFAALFSVVLSVIILVFVYSRLKRYISQKLHQRRYNQRCKSLPTFVYNPNDSNNQPTDNRGNVTECSICLADYQEGDVLTQLNCDAKHCFHQNCILTWIKMRNDCPLCRKSIF